MRREKNIEPIPKFRAKIYAVNCYCLFVLSFDPCWLLCRHFHYKTTKKLRFQVHLNLKTSTTQSYKIRKGVSKSNVKICLKAPFHPRKVKMFARGKGNLAYLPKNDRLTQSNVAVELRDTLHE